jgi:catalase
VTVRFSNFAGVPTIRDNDPQGSGPRGCAIRFHLADHVHTDIVAHSVDAFPFLTGHPKAAAFLQIPKPIPTSFARESFLAVSAFRFTNAAGVNRYGRYRILPAAGNEYLDEPGAAAQGADFLFDELKQRVANEPVSFRISVQLAEDGDTLDDATMRWPETRALLVLGEFSLRQIVPDNASEQQRIIFDPIPRVDGIDASADPLFEPRANIYLMSGRRRRAAGGH